MSLQQNNRTVTFAEFIENHHIQVPVIQRDYVQGHASTDKDKENRNDFVKKMMDALLPGNTPCHLDFVYGGREGFGSSKRMSEDAPFLPLDGQQRLTTLFLLHWILLQKNAVVADEKNKPEQQIYSDRLDKLTRFTYKTRISSGRFCCKLTGMNIKPDRPLIAQIKEKYWYDHDMQSDLTVKAMMQMLTLMEEMLDCEPYLSQKSEMLANLYDASKRCITFDVMDMDQYNLTDGLYVKMNARGKELTAFENWKAGFIDLLGQYGIYEKERFSYSIEHEWNDVFWKIAYWDYVQKAAKRERVPYPRIDEAFMNFFNNITRLLFFIIPENLSLKAEDYKAGLWSTVRKVYNDSRESCNLLFNLLDTLHEIDEANTSIHHFFDGIFYADTWSEGKVRIFGDGNIDLFETACNSGNFSVDHILLFAILRYCMKHKIYAPEERLQVYARICRNYLYEHNYFDSADVNISPQVRVNEMAQYLCFFDALAADTDPLAALEKLEMKDNYALQEKSKLKYYTVPQLRELVWRLEDLPYTYGNLNAFTSVLGLCISNPVLYCPIVWNAVEAFIKAPALTKVQLFVALGYHGVEVRNCAYGKAVFLGGEYGNRARWMVHFRKKYDGVPPLDAWMLYYVRAFMQENDLNAIVAQHIPEDKHSAIYYMLKYTGVLASQVYWRNNSSYAPFYFAMKKPWENLDMITIHSFSTRPLNNAYQVCPMANAVVRKISRFKKYDSARRMGYAGQFAYKQGIIINKYPNGWDQLIFSMNFGSDEWVLPTETFEMLPVSLQEKLKQKDESNYMLGQTEDKDLVEVAVDFVNKVIDEFEQTGLL